MQPYFGLFKPKLQIFITFLFSEESNWSKCLYTYLKAIFIYELKPENSDQVETLMRMVPQLKKRIAGKSLPVEKFVVRKARKYLEQGKRLVAPVHVSPSIKEVFIDFKMKFLNRLFLLKVFQQTKYFFRRKF